MQTGIQFTEIVTYYFTPNQLEAWIEDYCENTPPENIDEDYIKESLMESLRGYGRCEVEQSDDDVCDFYQVVKEIKGRMIPGRAEECDNIRTKIAELMYQVEELSEQLKTLEAR